MVTHGDEEAFIFFLPLSGCLSLSFLYQNRLTGNEEIIIASFENKKKGTDKQTDRQTHTGFNDCIGSADERILLRASIT